MTIGEMLDKLAAERAVYAARATLWTFLDRCGLRLKKDRARGRARVHGIKEAECVVASCLHCNGKISTLTPRG